MRWWLLLLLLAASAAAQWADSEDWAALANNAGVRPASSDYEETEKLDLCLKIVREDRCAIYFWNVTEVPALFPAYFESGVSCCSPSDRSSMGRDGTPIEIGQFDFTETILFNSRRVSKNMVLEATFTAIGTLNARAGECGHPFCEQMTFTIIGRRYLVEKPLMSKLPALSAYPTVTDICPAPTRHLTQAADEAEAATASADPAKTSQHPGVATLAAQVGPAAGYNSRSTKGTKYADKNSKSKYARAPSYSTKSKYDTKAKYDTKSKYDTEEYDTKEYDTKSKYNTQENDTKSKYHTKSKYNTESKPEEEEYKPYKPEGYSEPAEDYYTDGSSTAGAPQKAYMVDYARVYSGAMTINSRLHKTEYSQGWFEMVTEVDTTTTTYITVPPGERVYDPYTYKLSFYKPQTY